MRREGHAQTAATLMKIEEGLRAAALA